ncbi:NAD(P)/FAD-dependent oxidoreductase [Fimbriiglobus ruber]|uniref:Phytoene desaturase n=1 Tax=Fimbriiglobus ruber TaxID=1908690 RepID=A0A225E2Q8_9BACT|nr:NAD(P)/FAD-dependent oxidoreductase [Fimbriiglobus ruber]OWK42955.1 Phytoene desaturase [Fimbriiglobus ruber]
MDTSAEHWGIVGGGVLGLALADRLRAAGHRVTVLEAAPQLGGLAAAWDLGGITWDKHYHVILLSDTNVQRLLKDLGLDSEFVGVETKTGFYTDGRLYSMSNSLEFLRFPPLGLVSKFRLGLTISHASRLKDWKALEKIPVVEWLTKWSGRRTVEKIWLPLLRAKLGDSYKIASAAFIWAIIARMYAARRSGLKKEMFGYVRGGYARILDRFAQVLADRGVDIQTNAAVARVEPETAGTVRVDMADGTAQHFDRVVVTAAAPLASRLVPGLATAEHERLAGVTYQGIVCASVLLKNPLDRFYVTNITDDWVPFTAVIEMSTLVDRAAFGGNCLVYLPKYVAPNDPLFDESDESIRARFLTALARMYPHFREDEVLAFKVSRVRNVFAVSTLDYSAHVPSIATSLPGVYLVNSSQIVNGTLNVNETLQLADHAAATLLADRVPVPV